MASSWATMPAVDGGASRNNPLMTALAGPRFVTLITTLPLTAHWRYSPPVNDEIVSVSSTLPVSALMTWICSLRPLWSQSTA